MSACQCCVYPAWLAGMQTFNPYRAGDGSGTGHALVLEDAWSAALASLPSVECAFEDNANPIVGSETDCYAAMDAYRFQCSAQAVRYRWRFFTPTCYFKVTWNERLRITKQVGVGDPVLISETLTEKEYEETVPEIAGGLCVPADFDATDLRLGPGYFQPYADRALPSNMRASGDYDFTPVDEPSGGIAAPGEIWRALFDVIDSRVSLIPGFVPALLDPDFHIWQQAFP